MAGTGRTPAQGNAATGAMMRVVVEALDRIASPDARDSVLYMALADGGLETVPEDPTHLRRFALGPLRRAIELTIGREAAEAVITDLGPILERAQTTLTSGVRRRAVKSAECALLVATADPARARELDSLAPAGTILKVASDVFALVTSLDILREADLAIVVDCTMPSVRPAGLVTLARILPPTARVVLWGFSDELGAEATDEGLPAEWIRVDASATASKVAALAFPELSKHSTAPPPPIVAGEPARPTLVLVVDDDATTRGATAGHLGRAGCVVLTAPDAYIALDLAAEKRPDIVIVDDVLPGVTGVNLLRLMRRVLGPRAPATILLRSDGVEEPSDSADGVLSKGVDHGRLVEVVELLRRQRDLS